MIDLERPALLQAADAASRKTKITVCANCYRASCLQGVFLCEEYRTAKVIRCSLKVLSVMNLEHFDYWREEVMANEGTR